MTVFNLYCDESRHTSDPSQQYAVIGALQCHREKKIELVNAIHVLKAKYSSQGEFGWKRLSPNRYSFYQALLALFIDDSDLCFRCIVIDRHSLDHKRFNDGDAELGFYKLYYQMLVHWLQPGSEYHIYLDWQQNSSTLRFEDLRRSLKNKLTGRAKIVCLEPVESHTQPLIQLADLLIGAVGYQWNDLEKKEGYSETKFQFCDQLSGALGRDTLKATTVLSETKFNIFHWKGQD